MKYQQIILSVFIFFIFNLPAINPSLKSIPTLHQSPGLYAQDVDLGKLKKEEDERKKKTKKSKYVVTNETINKIEIPQKPYSFVKLGTKESKEANEAAATAGGETGNQVETEVTPRAQIGTGAVDTSSTAAINNRDYWQDQVKQIYVEMDKTEADLKNSQREFNQINNELQSIDIYEQRMNIINRMAELKKRIPELKQHLKNLNEALENLEDRARKLNIPSGWLRVDRPEPSQKDTEQGEQKDKTEKL